MQRLANILAPAAKLAAHREEVLLRAPELDPPIAIDIDNTAYGTALCNYLLLTYWPSLAEASVPEQPPYTYNRYYWFRVFVRQYTSLHGSDGGLEQQAFQMLEGAQHPIDWRLIKEIDEEVTKTGGASRHLPGM